MFFGSRLWSQLQRDLRDARAAAGLVNARWVMETVEKYFCGIAPNDRARQWQRLFETSPGRLPPQQEQVVRALAGCMRGCGSANEKGRLLSALYQHLSQAIHSPNGRAVDLDALGAGDSAFPCLVREMARLVGVDVINPAVAPTV